MINKNDESAIVNDLLKFLLCELKQRNMPISHFRLQKTVFKIKMELGEDHPLYEKLPFYWYNHGPFSEIVGNEFKKICDNYCYNPSSNTIALDNQFRGFSNKNDLIGKYPNIKDISDDIFSDSNFFLKRFDEKIYIDYAPYSFMHPFKYVLFETTRNEVLYNDLSPDGYLEVYLNCLCQLPYDDLLSDFFILFSRIYSRLDLLNRANQFMRHWNLIKDVVQESWFTFASGIRILFHDSFYDCEIDSWKRMFDANMADLEKSINLLEDETNFIFDDSFNGFNEDSFSGFDDDPFKKGIYEATIGNYLRE